MKVPGFFHGVLLHFLPNSGMVCGIVATESLYP